MSFTLIDEAPPRINRSQTLVLANRPEQFEGVATSAADVVMFEIEDNVPPNEKEAARRNIIEGLNDLDWGTKSVGVRINGLDTPFMYRDLVDLLEGPTERLDLIMIPKAGNAADIYAVDVFVTQIEQAMGRTKRLGFQIMIETAQGMANIDAIAAASSRNDSLHLGENDYAASLGARMQIPGGPHSDYSVLTHPTTSGVRERHWNDMWHYPMSRLVIAARANGLRAIDGPFGDREDHDGYRAVAARAATLGFDGKWTARVERWVEIANEVFSPSPGAVAMARRIIEAAANSPIDVATVDGKPIFVPQVKQAETLVRQAELLGM
jgi:malyl-CoA/(S)-citramalyl-CoA lyase